jgi:hypothetical protein
MPAITGRFPPDEIALIRAVNGSRGKFGRHQCSR